MAGHHAFLGSGGSSPSSENSQLDVPCYWVNIWSRLRMMRTCTQLCDIKLAAEDGMTMLAHSAVLAASSEVFHGHFTLKNSSVLMDTGDHTVLVRGISGEALKMTLDFVYGVIPSESDRLHLLLEGGQAMGITGALIFLRKKNIVGRDLSLCSPSSICTTPDLQLESSLDGNTHDVKTDFMLDLTFSDLNTNTKCPHLRGLSSGQSSSNSTSLDCVETADTGELNAQNFVVDQPELNTEWTKSNSVTEPAVSAKSTESSFMDLSRNDLDLGVGEITCPFATGNTSGLSLSGSSQQCPFLKSLGDMPPDAMINDDDDVSKCIDVSANIIQPLNILADVASQCNGTQSPTKQPLPSIRIDAANSTTPSDQYQASTELFSRCSFSLGMNPEEIQKDAHSNGDCAFGDLSQFRQEIDDNFRYNVNGRVMPGNGLNVQITQKQRLSPGQINDSKLSPYCMESVAYSPSYHALSTQPSNQYCSTIGAEPSSILPGNQFANYPHGGQDTTLLNMIYCNTDESRGGTYDTAERKSRPRTRTPQYAPESHLLSPAYYANNSLASPVPMLSPCSQSRSPDSRPHSRMVSPDNFIAADPSLSLLDNAAIKTHLKLNRRQEYCCLVDRCTYTNKCLDYMQSHLYRKHALGQPDVVCHLCDKAFFSAGQLKGHSKRAHRADSDEVDHEVPCEDCDEVFPNAQKLQTHRLKSHFKGRLFMCKECDFRSPRKKDVQAHMVSQHGSIPPGVQVYTCQHCEYKCTDKNRAEEHQAMHTGQPKFVCKICSKSYTTRRGMRTHMQYHSTERPHKCETCNASFKVRSKLRDHIRLVHTHVGVKPYECGYCGHRTALRGNCNQHSRKHHPGLAINIIDNQQEERKNKRTYDYAGLQGDGIEECTDIRKHLRATSP